MNNRFVNFVAGLSPIWQIIIGVTTSLMLAMIIAAVMYEPAEISDAISTPISVTEWTKKMPVDLQKLYEEELQRLVDEQFGGARISVACQNSANLFTTNCNNEEYLLAFDPAVWESMSNGLVVATQDYEHIRHECLNLGKVGEQTFFACGYGY